MSSSTSQPCAQYLINRSFWGGNYDVLQGGTHLYHVDNSHLTPGKPDLTFHAGADTSAALVAVCKYEHFSLDSEIGLGNPNQPNSMQWERLNCEAILSTRYTFRVGFGGRLPEGFVWKSTRSLGKGIAGNLKLVHETSQRLVAVFSAANGFTRKSGRLEIYGTHAQEFQFMVLITAVALRERLMRRGSGGGA